MVRILDRAGIQDKQIIEMIVQGISKISEIEKYIHCKTYLKRNGKDFTDNTGCLCYKGCCQWMSIASYLPPDGADDEVGKLKSNNLH